MQSSLESINQKGWRHPAHGSSRKLWYSTNPASISKKIQVFLINESAQAEHRAHRTSATHPNQNLFLPQTPKTLFPSVFFLPPKWCEIQQLSTFWSNAQKATRTLPLAASKSIRSYIFSPQLVQPQRVTNTAKGGKRFLDPSRKRRCSFRCRGTFFSSTKSHIP